MIHPSLILLTLLAFALWAARKSHRMRERPLKEKTQQKDLTEWGNFEMKFFQELTGEWSIAAYAATVFGLIFLLAFICGFIWLVLISIPEVSSHALSISVAIWVLSIICITYFFLKKSGKKKGRQKKSWRGMGLFAKSRFIAAVKSSKVERVGEFLVKGADPEAQDDNGYTALMSAAGAGHLEIIDSLLQHGANVNRKSKISGTGPSAENVTPLMVACWDSTGRTDVIKKLLKAGAAIDDVDSFGESAIMYAVTAGYVDIINELVSAGADVNITTGDGYTALKTAKEDKKPEIVEILRAAGATEVRKKASEDAY